MRNCHSFKFTLYLTSVVSVGALPGIFENYDTPSLTLEDLPPGAENVLKDKSVLPIQICGIVGAYLIFLVIAFGLLLTIGRRSRRAAQTSEGTLEMEMKRPKPIDTTAQIPLSPASTTRSWKSPFSPKRIRESLRKSEFSGKSAPAASVHTSVASFDGSVLESDRHERQVEMERLYAAVMEHDARKSAALSGKEGKSPKVIQTVELPEPISRPATVGSNKSPRRPPNIVTSNPPSRFPSTTQLPLSPASAISAKGSFRAIYPPNYAPESPITHSNFNSAVGHNAPPLPSPPSPQKADLPASPHSTTSQFSNILSSKSSHDGGTPKAKRGLRSLRIAAPPRRGAHDDDSEARTPLTATLNNNQDNMHHYDSAQRSGQTTPATLHSEYGYESMDKPAPLPWPAPQRGLTHPANLDTTTNNSHYENNNPNNYNNATSPPGLVPPHARSAASSTSTLPLRNLEDSMRSPPQTKTTFVDARLRTPLDALRSPGTAGPATPYSPYMPRTPVTPVTPHLVTRKEMKAQRRNRGHIIATQQDAVKDEKDLWGSGY